VGIEPVRTVEQKVWAPFLNASQVSCSTRAPAGNQQQQIVDIRVSITIGITTVSAPCTHKMQHVVDIHDKRTVEVAGAITWNRAPMIMDGYLTNHRRWLSEVVLGPHDERHIVQIQRLVRQGGCVLERPRLARIQRNGLRLG